MVLQTAGDATQTGLMLARDPETRLLLFRQNRLPRLPAEDLKVSQTSWHHGFGDYLWRSDDPFRYAYSDGVDLRHSNRAQLVNQFSRRLDFLIRNMDAEDNNTTGWTTVTATIANVTTNARAGSRNFEVVTEATSGSGAYQSLTNPTVYQGREITFRVYVRATTTNVEAFIQDSVATTVSTNHTGGSSYELLSVTRTIDAAATFVRVGVRVDTAAVTTFQIDGGWMEPTGGVIPYAMQEYSGAIYLACGRVIAVWSESNTVFDAVLVDDAEEFTSMAVHGNRIYAAHGTGYSHSNDTSDPRTTWTDVTPTNGQAERLFQALDDAGDLRLFRADLPNTIYVDNQTYGTAVAAGDWNATTYTVGETDKNITQVFTAFDSILVGREDGLWFWYPPDSRFRPATDVFKAIQGSENFDRGTEFVDGWFYTVADRMGLIRMQFQGGEVLFDQVGPNFQASHYSNFGGRIRALGHDGTWLYAIQDTPTADATATKDVWAMAARIQEVGGGQQLTWHTLKALRMGDVRGIFVESDFVWWFGRLALDGTNYQAIIFRMYLPTQHDNMMREATVRVETAGSFVTPIHDFAEQGYGEDDKGFVKVVVYAEGVSANLTVQVAQQIDGNISDTGSWTDVGAAITSVSAGIATRTFATTATGKRIRLRFTFASNVNSNSPVVLGYRLYAVPHPDRWWDFEVTGKLETHQLMLNGARDSTTAQNILGNLSTLDGEDYPIKLFTMASPTTAYNVQITEMEQFTRSIEEPSPGGTSVEHLEHLVRIRMREVLTT